MKWKIQPLKDAPKETLIKIVFIPENENDKLLLRGGYLKPEEIDLLEVYIYEAVKPYNPLSTGEVINREVIVNVSKI